jgi:hypothetical protein
MIRNVLFCGGPKDGVVFDMPEMRDSITLPAMGEQHVMQKSRLGEISDDDRLGIKTVVYRVTKWMRVWHNGIYCWGYTRCATASIGKPVLNPKAPMQYFVEQKPCPDFLDDFEGWWLWQCRAMDLTRFLPAADYDKWEFETSQDDEKWRVENDRKDRFYDIRVAREFGLNIVE